MLKKLKMDTLRAEVSSLDILINEKAEHDPVGAKQFKKRKNKLLEKLSTMEETTSPLASVGLFFGGNPVFGSKGIDSHFASSILDRFQSIVNKRYAFLENGSLSARGRVRNSNNAKLMITDVARGSFGFVLEETPKESLLEVDTELKHVVEDTTNILNKISSPDKEVFEEVFEDLDERTLNDVRAFYDELFNARATLKVVDDKTEYILSQDKISAAKNRMERLRISEERVLDVMGRLYIVPFEKRFELRTEGDGEPIRGRISKQFFDVHSRDLDDLLGKEWNAHLIARDIFSNEVLVNTKYILESIR
ncbi:MULTISPECIES: hypothetical protein [Klebsiella pneumoniae complex]|uniref:hypothetical protein n=1 Tax=Klebsiella pneumoniae complex TaxID=3390273 RepID=UPI000E2B32F9|nr:MULTISPECIES: hypothetical protein [Klebsiella]SVO31117.1 Uncharacterised protein [Klebsiella pneumoniae]SVO31818.1 Uncharacterised protein [Klebsiella pneumoniae]VGF58949.1 Uncharacterised protein [Klebsiella pneumoniae]VGJ37961.1 Uncharacterised protein [Klebsiella quasipneumoniae]HBY8313586.1 hypothetical protein [Klebsiella pneumoniae]